MTRPAEARLWQVLGGVKAGIAIVAMTYAYATYGLAPLERPALRLLIVGSFLFVAAFAELIAGRALHVKETQLTPREARLWLNLGIICTGGGTAIVVASWTQTSGIWLDHLAMGLAGGFSLLLGVLCLVGQRVMRHMHDMVAVREPLSNVSAGIAPALSRS